MKTRIPALCLLLLLAPTIYAAGPTTLNAPSENEYGIDPGKCYPGTVVTDLLRASEDEAVKAVREALAQGYKEGRIDGAALWKPQYDAAAARAEKAERRPTIKDLLLALLSGLALGAATTAIIAR